MDLRIVREDGGALTYYQNNDVVAQTWTTERGDHFWEVLDYPEERGWCRTREEAHNKIVEKLKGSLEDDIGPLMRGSRFAFLFELAAITLGVVTYLIWSSAQ